MLQKIKQALDVLCVCVYKPKELWKESTVCISIRTAQTVTRVTDASQPAKGRMGGSSFRDGMDVLKN